MSRFKTPRLREPGLDWASDMVHAENPETKTEDLQKIGERYENHRSQARPILIKIAQNPNASLNQLAALSDDYPEHVASNPGLKLMLVDDASSVATRLSPRCLSLLQQTVPLDLLALRNELFKPHMVEIFPCPICDEVECECHDDDERYDYDPSDDDDDWEDDPA